jgi:hypothetical protein
MAWYTVSSVATGVNDLACLHLEGSVKAIAYSSAIQW